MWPFNRLLPAKADSLRASITEDQLQNIAEEYLALHVHEDAELRAILRQDDAGWSNISESKSGELSDAERKEYLLMARRYGRRDALSIQTIALYTNFGVGLGIEWNADNKNLTKALDTFWEDKNNKTILSTQGQRRLSDELLTDGELFFAVFVTKKREVKLRTIDPLQITCIYTDLDDEATPRFYRRVRTLPKGQREETVLRDWMNGEPSGKGSRPGEDNQGNTVDKASPDSPLVIHVKLNGKERGASLLAPQLQWVRAHTAFMKARVAVQQSLARNTQKLKVKGGQAAVTAQAQQHRSSLASTGGRGERNPAPSPGALHVENQAASLENISQETGGNSAQIDGNQLLMMVGVGAGVFPHYYGAGEAFRLATASAMETPILRNFESYREIWLDFWRSFFDWVGEVYGIRPEKRAVNVVGPDIITDDIVAMMTAFGTSFAAVPELKESRMVLARLLSLLKINDPEDVLDDIEAAREESKAKADAMAKQIAAGGGPVPPLDPAKPPVPGQPVAPQVPPAEEDEQVDQESLKVLFNLLKKAVKEGRVNK